MNKLASCILFVAAAMSTGHALAAGPCEVAEFQAFNFWVGQWQVHTADGKLAGVNSITKEYNGCVLHERYDTGRGYSGESLNIYDAGRKVWHQSWVDTTGALLLLEGGLRNGNMVLEGQSVGTDALVTKHRITWTPNANGSVRQLWESTDAKGQWSVAFDGLYTKK